MIQLSFKRLIVIGLFTQENLLINYAFSLYAKITKVKSMN